MKMPLLFFMLFFISFFRNIWSDLEAFLYEYLIFILAIFAEPDKSKPNITRYFFDCNLLDCNRFIVSSSKAKYLTYKNKTEFYIEQKKKAGISWVNQSTKIYGFLYRWKNWDSRALNQKLTDLDPYISNQW